MDCDFDRLIDDALDALWMRDPVTATFAGESAHDARLPRADVGAEASEAGSFTQLLERLARVDVPDSSAARIDARHLAGACRHATAPFARTARYRNPAWYTGEAAFGILALLLAAPDDGALRARLAAIPDFFSDGAARLRDAAVPHAWAERARRELAALERLVTAGLPLHPLGAAVANDAGTVTGACRTFAAAIAGLPDTDAACGEAHLAFIARDIHGLREPLDALERNAQDAFDATLDALDERAAALDPARTWREQLAALAESGPDAGDVIASYARWHARALEAAGALVTPAADYGLSFRLLPEWARTVAGDLYFLWYRSPPARAPGTGSTYWIAPPAGSPADVRRTHNTAAVKLVHAVHHGSIGHHTQNARARRAASRFARVAGTDGASGIALLAAGTMAEGWACYAEDLLAEVPGFFTPAEHLMLLWFELRNIAAVLADIRFHTGRLTLDEMGGFYRDRAHFAAARIAAETTRNSMFPGSRLMYWYGTRQIKALRAASTQPARAFHDELLAYGSVPIGWIADELAAASPS